MRLADKGEIQPPPVLDGSSQRVSLEVQTWPGIIAATHWFLYDRSTVDGTDFYVGEEELGHIHLAGEVHLATTPALQKALVAAKLARVFRYAEGWVEFDIESEADADHALWLFRLNYDRITGVAPDALVTRIEDKAAALIS